MLICGIAVYISLWAGCAARNKPMLDIRLPAIARFQSILESDPFNDHHLALVVWRFCRGCRSMHAPCSSKHGDRAAAHAQRGEYLRHVVR
eukprot:15465802-Alexandrium_andersonii.AAC.1